MQRIQAVSFFSFLLEDFSRFPASIQHFAGKAFETGGEILVCRQEEQPVGVLCLEQRGGERDVVYLYVLEEARRRGVAQALLAKAVEDARNEGEPVTMRVIAEHPYAACYRALCAKLGFAPAVTATIFHARPCYPEKKAAWEAFKARRGRRNYEWVLRKGGAVSRFSQAPAAVLSGMKEEVGRQFPHYLDPFAVPNPRQDEYSFLFYEGDRALSFVTASQHGNRVLFEQTACRKDCRNTGAFFPPLYHFIDTVIQNQIHLVTFTVYDANLAVHKMTDGYLKEILSDRKHQCTYIS